MKLFMVTKDVKRAIIARGGRGDKRFLSVKYRKSNVMATVKTIHSGTVIPTLSIVDSGSAAAFLVKSSVRPINLSRIPATVVDTICKGEVSSVMKPAIKAIVATGSISTLVKINQVGNLLKNVIVSGRVPAWAVIVVEADRHRYAGNGFLISKIPARCFSKLMI